MVELQILSGTQSGTRICSHHFPIHVGRAQGLDLTSDEPGVWPLHCQIRWEADGLFLDAEPDALTSVNDTAVRRSLLRNGDIITLGALKLRFTLSSVRQTSTVVGESLTWISLGALSLGQVALVYILLRL